MNHILEQSEITFQDVSELMQKFNTVARKKQELKHKAEQEKSDRSPNSLRAKKARTRRGRHRFGKREGDLYSIY